MPTFVVPALPNWARLLTIFLLLHKRRVGVKGSRSSERGRRRLPWFTNLCGANQPLEAAIADRLGDMLGGDPVARREIGDRPGDAGEAVDGAS